MDVTLDYSNVRAKKARVAAWLKKPVRITFGIAAGVFLLGGAALVISGLAIGWIIAGLAAFPIAIVEWYNGELRGLAPSKQPKNIADILDSNLLGRLKKQPKPSDISTILGQLNDAQFFAVRFGITANVLQDLATHNEQLTSEQIFESALEIMKRTDSHEISSGILIAALIKHFPNYDSLLAHIHINFDDIIEGIMWQKRLKLLINAGKTRRHSGGIARDWSFGYTPLLSQFGQNISQQVGSTLTVETSSHEKALQQLIETFASGGRQNAALVGATGVGKTSLVYAFAERLLEARSKLPSSLKFRQIVMLDASALISAAPGRGQLEELVSHILSEAYAAKNIIIYLDNAQVFFEEGLGSVNLSNILLPILEAGRLRIVLSMDEQRFLQISQRNAQLAGALNRIRVEPTNSSETMQVLEHQLILTEFQRHVTFTYQSLAEACRLSERYIHDVAMPGQAVRLLEASAGYAENGLVTINSVQQAIEQTMNIKVSVASESDDREKLLHLEDLIHKRMINQTRAVSVVSDALRRARAGVRNQNRPIGTFLFLGPTGVGKTELAKALADVYFGGEKQIIRLDLNEYVRNEDVARLIADGATDASSLTAQAAKQPFSVVLLDEIEKAHPNVLTTLLQLLDEGILRDVNNREVSFRDAIVIATSNAGADRIREYIQRGYKIEQFEQQFMDELINSNQFRPEFLNRFDEIVMFTPLGKAELLQVVDLMIAQVNATLSTQKVSVKVDDNAKSYLVDAGYDPRLGARPMRRVVQKAVENTVATLMLSDAVEPGTEIIITLDQVKQQIDTAIIANKMIEQARS